MRLFVAFFPLLAIAQSSAPLTLNEAMRAARDYPAIAEWKAQLGAADSTVDLAKTAYLPKVDGVAQLNRATRNNIFGLLLPQYGFPSISGPVLGTNDFTTVWGSAVGLNASWEPFDFGLRRANVAIAEYGRERAVRSIVRSGYELTVLVADAFLTVLAADQTIEVARAAVDRAKVLEQSIGGLTNSGLRPGGDLSRAQAERAIAETQVAQAEQAAAMARATLAQLTGRPVDAVAPGHLLEMPPSPAIPTNVVEHPLVREHIALIDEVKARERALDRSYFPKFNLQGVTYARGTGARTDGSTGGAAAGIGPNFQNWAVGMSVSFSVLEFKSLRARKGIEAANERAAEARRDTAVRELDGQRQRAQAQLEGARRVAALTPVQRKSAQETFEQTTARYKAGLIPVVEVADAQRLVTQTEIDDVLARLNVWRALLAAAAAAGDLNLFLGPAGN
jgi:outer membrane protein TolC